jgi:hypothetical protein
MFIRVRVRRRDGRREAAVTATVDSELKPEPTFLLSCVRAVPSLLVINCLLPIEA